MKGTVDHISSTCNLKRQKYHRKEIFKLETWQDSKEFSTKQGGKVGWVRSMKNIPASFLVTANKHLVVSCAWRQEGLWGNMALYWIRCLFYGWIPASVGSHGFSNHHAKHHPDNCKDRASCFPHIHFDWCIFLNTTVYLLIRKSNCILGMQLR